jgi:hypothetical protein
MVDRVLSIDADRNANPSSLIRKLSLQKLREAARALRSTARATRPLYGAEGARNLVCRLHEVCRNGRYIFRVYAARKVRDFLGRYPLTHWARAAYLRIIENEPGWDRREIVSRRVARSASLVSRRGWEVIG